MKTYREYKESLMEENPSKLNEENKSTLLSIDIQLDENNTKKFELNSSDDLDNKLNAFCEENNLPDSAKKYIHNSILEVDKLRFMGVSSLTLSITSHF